MLGSLHLDYARRETSKWQKICEYLNFFFTALSMVRLLRVTLEFFFLPQPRYEGLDYSYSQLTLVQ